MSNAEQICTFYIWGVKDKKSKKNIRKSIKDYCLCHVDAMRKLTEEEREISSMREFAVQLKNTMNLDSNEFLKEHQTIFFDLANQMKQEEQRSCVMFEILRSIDKKVFTFFSERMVL